jgi:molybdenum cofactor cytidylyltransferase
VTRSEGAGESAGLILAAGRSTRMAGRSKLLREFDGSTVIRRVVCTAASAGLDPIAVTVGHDGHSVRAALEGLAVEFAAVPRAPVGRLVSVLTGLEALGDSCSNGVLILLGDEPGMTVDHVRAVREAGRSGPQMACRASYRDRPGHPVFLPAAVARSIRSVARDHGPEASLWRAIVDSGLPHRNVPIDAVSPVDVDTPEDLARAREGRSDS